MKISGYKVPTQDLRKVDGPVGSLFSCACYLRLFGLEPFLHPFVDGGQDRNPGAIGEGAGGLNLGFLDSILGKTKLLEARTNALPFQPLP